MKIHFIFPTARPDWAFVNALRDELPESTIDCGGVSGFGRHRHRYQLIAKTPWLAYSAFKSLAARIKQQSLIDYVCVETDVEIIGCLLAKIVYKKNIPIILLGFIYTPRKSSLLRLFRWMYYRLLLSKTDAVICYSKHESLILPDLFRLKNTLFASMLFGGKLNIPKELVVKNGGEPGYIVSAGRSGRDYNLLCEAVRSLPVKLHIICDSRRALEGVDIPQNVTVLDDCHGKKYIEELAGADMVILPLRDSNLSSGQMVLLDAMALGKVVIITKTLTTIEYGEHLKTCYFVEPDSVAELQRAIEVCYEPSVIDSVGAGARQRYQDFHAIGPCVNSLVRAIGEISRKAAQKSV